MREGIFISIIGTIGSLLVLLFGGWSTALITLIIFMGIDYLTGLLVAGLFKSSKKSETGALESKAGWKGLCRKGMILLIVLIAYQLDVKDAVIIAFIANETISIIENAGLMGVPVPQIIMGAIDILIKKDEEL